MKQEAKIKKSLGRINVLLILVVLILSLTILQTIPANPSGTNIIITEVFYDTPGTESKEEWIELYNPSTSSIDIGGWTITDNSGTSTLPSHILAVGDYFVFARDNTGFNALYGFNPDSDSLTRSLNNAGDQLSLKDGSGTEVDFVAWEGGYSSAYPTWDLGNAVEVTIRRVQDANGDPVDTDGPSDWEVTTDYGDPGAGYGTPPPPPPPPTLLDIDIFFNDPLAGLPSFDNPLVQEGNLTSGIVSLIDAANTTIDAALYHLSYQPIVDALNNAVTRGVTVRIARDNQGDSNDKWDQLVGVQITDVTTSAIMHNKFFIVDGSFVFTGSANPTETGYAHNANDGVRVRSTEVATQYQAEFDLLFQNIRGKSKCSGTSCNSAVVENGQIEVFFSPESGDNGYSRFIQLIDQTTTTLHLSIFYMTENGVYDAIVRARDRGVQVKGVFDHRGWLNSYSEADDVIAWGGGIVDANPGVYHHKFAVFDSQIVWVGSTNWSNAGFNDNDENTLVIHDAGVAGQFVARTEEYYDDGVGYDNSESEAPRIVTRHYSGWQWENFISWRARMNGNNPRGDLIQTYLLWRWNDVTSEWDVLKELNWANEYYSDASISFDTMHYYCLSSISWTGVESGCSAEYAEETSSADGSSTKGVILNPTGHRPSYGSDLTSPVVTLVNPADAEIVSGQLDISVEADDTSFVKDYKVYIDGVLQGSSSLVQVDTSTLSDGSHIILAEATDIFGNIGSDTITIQVDNTGYSPATIDYSNVKFMTYNVEESGINPNYKQVLKEENADVIVLVETGLMSDLANRDLNQLTVELNEYFGSSEVYYNLISTFGQSNKYTGAAILSRFPVNTQTLLPVLNLDDGSEYDVTHDFLHANLQVGENSVDVVAVHLKASSGTTNEYRREREIEGIMNFIDTLGLSSNVIIMGDYNSQPDLTIDINNEGSQAGLGYNIYPIFFDGANPYSSSVHSWTDVFRSLNPSEIGHTYYTSPYESRIDWVMMNQGFSGLLKASTTGDTASADIGSDHYSVDVITDLSSWAPQDTIPPAQVTGLSAVTTGSSQIDLSWNSNGDPDFDYYNIYRDGQYLASTSQNTYSDTGLTPSTQYSYEVSAVDTSSNEGIKSDPASATTDPSNPPQDTIVISEVFYDAPGSDRSREWIELYNYGLTNVDLSGWQISDNSRTWTIPTGTVLGAGQYLVIARSSSGFNGFYGFAPDLGGLTTALGNSGDELTLRNNAGTVVDYVAWENYASGWNINASTGDSIARIDPNTDTDTVTDWTTLGNNGTPGT